MKQTLIVAGAALLASGGAAYGKPAHAKHGKSKPPAGHSMERAPMGYGVGGCPPGLAKKNNGCMPPGQAKKLYNVGQRFPTGYGHLWNYNQIPNDLRRRYGFDPNQRYYYGDGYLYRVDPRTMLIAQVVSALLR